MGLFNVREILSSVSADWAVGAFNVNNFEDVQAVTKTANELRSPVILQVSEGVTRHMGLANIAAICRIAAEQSEVPVAVHLDHCQSPARAVEAMRHGFSSVMFDGSKLPFAENAAITKRIVDIAKYFNVSVEAELGIIGGVEDDIAVLDGTDVYTDPEEAAEFVKQTGVDVIAPAIGTVHGMYRSEPNIDLDRLAQIAELVKIPIALHGGSGLAREVFGQCIRRGAKKINVGTELKHSYFDALHLFLNENPGKVDPRGLSTAVMKAVSESVAAKIHWFQSGGRISESGVTTEKDNSRHPIYVS